MLVLARIWKGAYMSIILGTPNSLPQEFLGYLFIKKHSMLYKLPSVGNYKLKR